MNIITTITASANITTADRNITFNNSKNFLINWLRCFNLRDCLPVWTNVCKDPAIIKPRPAQDPTFILFIIFLSCPLAASQAASSLLTTNKNTLPIVKKQENTNSKIRNKNTTPPPPHGSGIKNIMERTTKKEPSLPASEKQQ